MKVKVPNYIKAIASYVPGKSIEALEREYGITDSIKLASNENPLGPSPLAQDAVQKAIAGLHRYPDGAGYVLLQRLADHLNVATHQIVMGNGSDDILGMLTRVLLQPGDEVITPKPSFLLYDIVAKSAGAKIVHVPLKDMAIDLKAMAQQVNARTRLIFICNPNNPTGTIVVKTDFEVFLKSLPASIVVVVDEAYIEFVRDPQCIDTLAYLDRDPSVVVLRTFSKAYGLAGLRVGYGVMNTTLAEFLNRVRMPFNVNSLAQVAAVAALENKAFLKQTIDLVHQGLDFFYEALQARGVNYFSSQSNFLLIDVNREADVVFEQMLRLGVIVRSMRNYGYPHYIRINVGLPKENQRFLDALDQVL